MKKMITMIAVFSMVATAFTGIAFADPGNGNAYGKAKKFKDMTSHWGAAPVERIQSYGLINGYTDGTFQPNKAITQAELAVIINRLTQLKENLAVSQSAIVNEDDLSDVPAWAKEAVANGFGKKYFNMKRFHSQTQCDRLTAAVALAKALQLDPVTDVTFNPFADSGLMSDEDYGYVLALYQAGYIKGYPNGNFNPNAFLSRAQLASIIDQIMKDDDHDEEAAADNEKPIWPEGSIVTASAIDASSLTLKWTAASDNIQVTGYKVSYYLNSVEKIKLASAATAAITGLDADKTYTFSVEARDAAGNWSINGPSVGVKTLAVSDTVEPTWPTAAALTVSPSSSEMVTLIWPDAEDNIAVEGYKVYQDGVLIETLDADTNDLVVSGLTSNTEYAFKVRAFDAAGNMSLILSKSILMDE